MAPYTYVNPLEHATLTPERIDMGVDYAGSGSLVAIGRAMITGISPGGWGQYGNYLQYKILAGPLAGRTVYYAEGVNPAPGLHVGQIVNPGQTVANLIPGWHYGIEIGYAGTTPDSTYASQFGGGYQEGQLTAAGLAFSNLIKKLGGQPGLAEGRQPTGTYQGQPLGNIAGAQQSGGPLSGIPGVGVVTDIANFVSNPMKVLLTVALVIAGAVMLYKGLGQTLGLGAKAQQAKQAAA